VGEFKAKRKGVADNVTIQANTATNVPVVLKQHLHTSFIIKDADQSKAFKDLVVEYLHPAMLSIARGVDQIVGGQVHQFHANGGGSLGGLTGDNAEQYLLESRQVMNINKAYVDDRNLILSPASETSLLSDPKFLQAYSVGDDGTALRDASLGRKLGFNIFMAQNQPYVAPGNTTAVGALNNAGGYGVGTKTVTVDGFAAAIPVNAFVVIDGEGSPLRVVSTVGGATPTSISFSRGLKAPVKDNAAVTVYTPATVNNASGYAVGYDKEITIDNTTVAPRVGQCVTFGTGTTGPVYSIIDVETLVGITLDRPLEAAISDNDQVNLGPAGSFNFAFHRNALALVNRPLALPIPGTGARAGVANYNGLSIRVVMTYDGNAQGTLVTVDTLLGVKVLDTLLGAVMYG
jgi:P22 coat protein - gene protein 5